MSTLQEDLKVSALSAYPPTIAIFTPVLRLYLRSASTALPIASMVANGGESMTLCKWQGGGCEQETNHPSGLCAKHRVEDEMNYERSREAAVQKFADAIREEVRKQKAVGISDAEIQA
jgi:hypothetical protein